MSRPLTAEYSLTFTADSDRSNPTSKPHHTDTGFYKVAFNTDAQKISDLFTSETFIDPFNLSSPPTNLVNFATGVEASVDVQSSLLKWPDTGES